MALAEALAEVERRIAAACARAGRARASVTLCAVSKTVAAERVAEALRLGQPIFGENYAQELRDKAPEVPGARWHYIGPLQRNKVKYVVGVAELVHSLDTQALADELARRAAAQSIVQRCLVQVNIGDEPQKSGCRIAELPSLLAHARTLPSLRVEGLMCIPPAGADPAPHFSALAALARTHALPELSMGMSDDFETAITHGATIVRVGSAIFGARR